ncbi:fibronectin type III domain-containing protein [Desulfogranum marinum]|uniref:fibronectin type III domain-containing protein n=1 Tax=Desulfogranum marinum TaxID=453220 RepID=UPI0019659FF1|nr:fibronectin type III domain-containing protein [Desulfogranum marinum]MBM9513114.1 fibronectin type III domain-containing protein [Desulfogranum marinum]
MKILTMGIVGIFLSATATFAATCTEQFSWKPNTGADITGYKIHYGLTNGGPYSGSLDVGNPDPTNGRIIAAVPNLTCGKTYYFVATSYDKAGSKSNNSNQVKLSVTAPGSSSSNEQYPLIINVASD